jgi:hypothetical protein
MDLMEGNLTVYINHKYIKVFFQLVDVIFNNQFLMV